jgi:multidrug efflux pump subunit AcrA (membrane-fusion protein)
MKGGLLRWLLPTLAIAGIAYAVFFTSTINRTGPPTANQLALPAESRFPSTVAGSGLVEANSRNVAVGSFLPGIVGRVAVIEGQWVRQGETLFALDRRQAEADLSVAERDLAAAEDRVAEAEAELADRTDQLRRVMRLKIGEVVTEDRRMRLEFAERVARAQLASMRAMVEVERARVQAAGVTLERLTVAAPIEGRVLKVNVRPGEFVVAGETERPPVLMGNDRPLHVRVQVDENDLWRFRPGAPAEAVVRGNRDIRFPLGFVRVEPYVEPKRSLTGDTLERIDTRVLEVIYSFDPGDQPIYIGQQVDVFVEARPAGS